MKKTVFVLAITLLFVACKKDKTAAPTLEVIGSWSTYSDDDTFFTLGNVTADQYPCIADNTLTFKLDSTYTQTYSGTSVCSIGPLVTFGTPGQAPLTGTWHRSGNDIYIGLEHYAISNANGKMILTLHSAFTVNGITYTDTGVLYKK